MEQFGRYELRRRLGVGGMAEVYEAVSYGEHGVEKPLVIKRILEEHGDDDSFRRMFIDEARIAMRLNHPNVVQVFEFGKANDRYFLAMELVRGRDLGALLERAKKQDRTVPAGVALFVAGEVAKGLDHAHRLTGPDGKMVGLVHRDVSPQNVLLSTDGSVKIGDFGIAKFDARRGVTQAATVRGKVRYMSPEQCDSLPLDPRSDLFSLGIVLYQMITGTTPFDGHSDLDVLDDVRRASPRRPSEHTAVPAELERIVLKALARDPARRYARGNELARDLESLAIENGLRATSGALAEFLLSLFPELEQRSSDAGGETQIRRLPDHDDPEQTSSSRVFDERSEISELSEHSDSSEVTATASGPGPSTRREVTQIRRMLDPDGMPVYISETTTGGAIAGESSVSDEPTESAVVPIGAIPRREPSVSTVARPSSAAPVPHAPSEASTIAGMGSARAKRADSIATNPRIVAPPINTDELRPSDREHATTRSPVSPTPTPRPLPPPATPPPARAPEPERVEAVVHERAPRFGPPAALRRDTSTDARAPLTAAVAMLILVAIWFLMKWTPLGRGFQGTGDVAGAGDEATGVGTLCVQGTTGDQLYVDGEMKGPTPLCLQVPAGLREVRVTGVGNFERIFGIDVRERATVTRRITRDDAGAP